MIFECETACYSLRIAPPTMARTRLRHRTAARRMIASVLPGLPIFGVVAPGLAALLMPR